MPRRRIILESPYAADTEAGVQENIRYARACLLDSIRRGEAPFASHLLYAQPGVLDDRIPSEREEGIDAGVAWEDLAEATVLYLDRGISPGMKKGLDRAQLMCRPIEFRRLYETAPQDIAEALHELIHQSLRASDAQ